MLYYANFTNSVFIEINTFKLKNAKYLCFDEVDRLFERGVSLIILNHYRITL